MEDRFSSGACVAVADVLRDSLTHFWPPVVLGDKFVGSCLTRIASCWVIMAGFQDSEEEVREVRNIY